MTPTPEAISLAGLVLRWGVIAASAYLGALVLTAVVARLTDAGGGAGAFVLRLAAPGTGRVVAALLGASLALPAPASADTAPTDHGPAGDELVLRRLPDDASDLGAPHLGDGAGDAAPPVPAPPEALPAAAPPVPAVSTWTVAPGEHLWHVAEHTVAARIGRAPTDAEVAPYWRRLVEANRDRLVDRGNADLVLPGQVLVVPA